MIKKILSVVICLMLVMGLAACGEADPNAIFGKVDGQVYRNDFLGLTCTAPSGWEYYTEQQMLELNNMVETYYDDDVREKLSKATIVQDMCVTNPQNGCNINLNLEKLSTSLEINVKTVLEAQIDALRSTYENMGATDITITSKTITVSGREFHALVTTCVLENVNFYVTTFAFQRANYLANVSITSTFTDQTSTMLSFITID
ncbi:MAG: hypothetical protein IKY44_02575 [Clostridia bacterium]|nr:hypothetical protein [Clostridia bacterium]